MRLFSGSRRGHLLLSPLLLAGAVFCFGNSYAQTAQKDAGRLKVAVSIAPMAYFVERVGGQSVDVTVLVTPGQSPATFDPTPRQVAELAQADVYFRVGVPFEQRLVQKLKSALPDLRVVDTRQGIKLRPMDAGHSHEGSDPHIWLDPMLVKVQARTICEELVRLDPKNEAVYTQYFNEFQADLDSVHARITGQLAPLKGRKLYVFHPSYGYFADAYGLQQVAVEVEGKEPAARQLSGLIEQARDDGVRTIFVQPQYASSVAESIAEAIGGKVVMLDPLARDYLDNLEDMTTKIVRALGGEG